MRDFQLAKKILKESGVKGFRKLKLKRVVYVAGKQCSYINKHVAERVLNRLVDSGFEVGGFDICMELAKKGLLDTISVS